MADLIIDKFYQKMAGVNLEAFGILDSSDCIHTLGTDSKIIGRIFEMYTQPVLEEIAEELEYIIETPKSQTVYPDFVLFKPEKPTEKIAIDIKTTYINTERSTIKFTLGSYGSYMRNNTKNIEYKYTDYSKHYVIGFVYKRNGLAQESHIYKYENRKEITFPYNDVKYFIEEKFKIAGDKPGSGNTENIGSFPTKNFSDLKFGKGPFSELGQDIFDIYWRYYPKYRTSEKAYTSLDEFLDWLPSNIDSIELFHEYNAEDIIESIARYKFSHQNK